MYSRFLPTPTRSVFLFGPRGTGKSTWLRDRFPDAATYDLLDTREALRLAGSAQARKLVRKERLASYGVYLGARPALWDDVHVLPLMEFLKRLWSGELIR